MKKAIFTIVSKNYIPYVIMLADSIKEGDVDFFCIVLDFSPEIESIHNLKKIKYINAEELEVKNWKQFVFQYSALQTACALKPKGMSYLLDKGYDKVIFLDSDILVYSEFNVAWKMLDKKSIVLTPHHLQPPPYDGKIPTYLDTRVSGIFNSGFAASNRNGEKFLKWWWENVSYNCIFEPMIGIFNEQHYLNDAITVNEDTGIIRDKGYNVAIWNLHEREISDECTIEGEKITFFHFCKPESAIEWNTRFEKNTNNIIYRMHLEYISNLNAIKNKVNFDGGYRYNSFNDGEIIDQQWREWMRKGIEELTLIEDPFNIKKSDRIQIKNALIKKPDTYRPVKDREVNDWRITYLASTPTLAKILQTEKHKKSWKLL